MARPQVKINPAAGDVTAEVIVGNAHHGWYHLWLWDATGTASTDLGEGVNADDVPDIRTLPVTADQLNGRILTWRLLLSTFANPQPGDRYNATIILRQDGQALHDPDLIHWEGDFGEYTKQIEGGVTLVHAN